MAIEGVAARIELVRDRMRVTCEEVGRDPSSVCLVAASKGQPVESIEEAYAAGQRDFGENFAQELKQKASRLSNFRDIRWHFIGRFQSNKSNLLVRTGALVQSVSSVAHLKALSKRHLRKPVQCMIQVRLDDGPERGGAHVDNLDSIVHAGRELSGVNVTGLMLVPPQEHSVQATVAHFERLRSLADTHELPDRSMGMSGDFELAITHGSTMVRVGTAIFGPRPRP